MTRAYHNLRDVPPSHLRHVYARVHDAFRRVDRLPKRPCWIEAEDNGSLGIEPAHLEMERKPTAQAQRKFWKWLRLAERLIAKSMRMSNRVRARAGKFNRRKRRPVQRTIIITGTLVPGSGVIVTRTIDAPTSKLNN